MKITGIGGFHMQFRNGWTASIQFGAGNYCQNHHADLDFKRKEGWESSDAEVARWPSDGEFEPINGSDTVKGWLSADDVLAFLNETAAKAKDTR
ncbi:hypothetical protein LCGC14_0736070 [marine sediment metagenome]|uniref:Uncharacterized protein n=1 Tax=marine sediment metagenome TaxID=412755 RepID=A0A0F9Q856_9ZZZZ